MPIADFLPLLFSEGHNEPDCCSSHSHTSPELKRSVNDGNSMEPDFYDRNLAFVAHLSDTLNLKPKEKNPVQRPNEFSIVGAF